MPWTAPDSPSFPLPAHLGFASRICLERLDAVQAHWRFSTQLDANPIQAGLQNNLNRWYDPVAGCWLSVDPWSFKAGDANLYRYVQNQPSILVDTSGLYSGVWGFFQDYAHYFVNRDEMGPWIRAVDKVGIGMATVGIGGLCGMAAAGTVGFVAAELGACSVVQGIVGAVVGGYYGREVAGLIGAYGGEEVEGSSRFLGGLAGSWVGWIAAGGPTWGIWYGQRHFGWTVTVDGERVLVNWMFGNIGGKAAFYMFRDRLWYLDGVPIWFAQEAIYSCFPGNWSKCDCFRAALQALDDGWTGRSGI